MGHEPENLAPRGVKLAVAGVRKWLAGPDRAEEYRKAGIEEWDTYVARRIGDMAERVEHIESATARLESDRELALILDNYRGAAWREAIDERRQMLGDAAARTATSPRPTDELARIERVLARLDPEDIATLIELVTPPENLVGVEGAEDAYRHVRPVPAHAVDSRGAERWRIIERSHLGGANLIATGCVLILTSIPPQGPERLDFSGRRIRARADEPRTVARITGLGVLLLQFLGHLEIASADSAPEG